MKLLIQPGDGVTAILNAIKKAETSVEIAIFRFDHEGVEEALISAAKRGVFVHALIAHVNGTSAEALRKLEMRFLEAGITVARTDTALARYHSKYIVVDRRELFVLAFNFTHQDIERSRSFGLITKNRKLVRDAVCLFEADTKRQQYKPESPYFIVSPLNSRKQLSQFIKGAKQELVIYDPKLTDTGMIKLLQERRDAGVTVRVIGRSTEAHGLDIRRCPIRLHTRTIVRDAKAAFVGSQSLRELELDGRREVGIVCRERSLVTQILGIFEKDWKESEGAAPEIHPVRRVAKKIAKAIATELPKLAPIIEEVAKEIDVKIAPEEVDQTVRAAVKDVVKTVVQEAIEEKVKETAVTNA